MTAELIKTLYFISFVISVFYFLSLAVVTKKHNIYHLCASLLVVTENVGALCVILSTGTEMAMLGNRITFISVCFMPLALVIVWCRICGFRMNDFCRITLAVISGISLALAWFQGDKGVFYKTAYYYTSGGISGIRWTRGPGFYFCMSVQVMYLLIALGVWIYAARSKKRFSHHTIIPALLIFISISSGHLFSILMRHTVFSLSVIPFGYTVSLFFFNILFTKLGLYDMSISLLNMKGRTHSNGYIVFDRKNRLTAYNTVALGLFPELDEIPVDSIGSDYLYTSLYELIYKPLFVLNHNSTDIFEIKEKKYYGSVKDICDTFSNKSKGYIVELLDATYSFKTKEIMETSSARLKQDVYASVKHIEEIRQSIVSGMASMIESRDRSTGGHIIRTSDVVGIFIEKLKQESYPVPDDFLHKVVIAAPMHDLGKIAVDDEVLKKQGKYTPEEFDKMKLHASEGARIVRKVLAGYDDQNLIDISVNVAHYHHEKWNGNGYPDGLKEEEIPLEARIMALADVFDALVSKRCYKEAYSYDEAFSIIRESSGSHFDPALTEYFLQCRPELEKLYNENKA